MNRKLLAALIAWLVAAQAQAQESAVSIYGAIDSMLRYTTNEVIDSDSAKVGNKLKLGEGGALQGSRLGFMGEEKLGAGTSAIFKLEMGFTSNSGESDQQGQLFGRQAYIGLKDKNLGELTAGRQYGVAFDFLGNYDPVGIGNMPENEWQLFLMGVRFDNTLKYTNAWGPVRAEVQYSVGGQTGSSQIGSTSGLGLTYTEGPVSIGLVGQQSIDQNSKKLTVLGIGTSYEIDAATLFLNYFNAKRDSMFVISSDSGGALANTSILGNADNLLQRSDGVFTAGLQYKTTPSTVFTLGYMVDSVRNETSSGTDGRISTSYAVLNYYFSKRTDIYLGIDYIKVGGGEIDNGSQTNTILQFAGSPLAGNTSRTGVAIGLRTSF